MNYLQLAKMLAFIILSISIVIYIFGDPIDKLLSYQGPILGGALMGWYILNSASSNKVIEDENGEKTPVTAILIRRYAPIGLTIGLAIIIPWLTPFLFRIEESDSLLYVFSFTSMLIGGFLIGYVISSFKFIEKIVIYSLGFIGDILYFFIIYIASQMFGIPQLEIANYVLVMVYAIKFPEGAIFGFYIIKRVKAI